MNADLNALLDTMINSIFDEMEDASFSYNENENERNRRFRRKQRNLHIKKGKEIYQNKVHEDVPMVSGKLSKNHAFESNPIPQYRGYSLKDIRHASSMMDDLYDYITDDEYEDDATAFDVSDLRKIKKNKYCCGRGCAARFSGIQSPTRDRIDVDELMSQREFLKELHKFFD